MSRRSRTPVLVVEDDEELRGVLGDLLDEEGFEPTVVGTLHDARECLASKRPRAVVVDLELDGECGEDLLGELSTRMSAPPTVIFSGALDAPRTARRYAVPWVSKPSGVDSLVDAIDRARAHAMRPGGRTR